MTPRQLLLPTLLAGAVFATTSARADVVTTKDGLVLEGDATKQPDGGLVVVTDAGEVRLAASSVAMHVVGEGPRAAAKREAAAIEPADVEALYRLALKCEAAGLADLAKAEYEAILRSEPDHAAARRALSFERVGADWLPVEEARRRRGLVLYEGKWLLPAEAEAAARAAAASAPPVLDVDGHLLAVMKTAAVGEPALKTAAALALAGTRVPDRVAGAVALLNDADPKVRSWACETLGALGDESSLRPLILSATRDADPDVRRAAVIAATAFGHDDLAIPFIRALDSRHPGLVANAGKALAAVGDPRAIVYVVKRIVAHGGSARSVVQVLNQVSYVRDYDVEIAQASNIANPQIGYLKEGNVLDIKVIDAGIDKTVVETVLVDTLNSLAGTSLHSTDDVLAWYQKHASELTDFPPAPGARHPKPPAGRSAIAK